MSSTHPEQPVQDQRPGGGPCGASCSLPTPHELAVVTLAMQHPLSRTWDSDQARLPRLAAAHQGDLDLATNTELADFRANYFGFPGLEAPAYLDRWQPVDTDLCAWMSMRFEGRARSRPFVELSGLSRPWTPADLPTLRQAALETYGAFAPLYLRLFSSAPVDAVPGLGRDRRFVAAPVSELVGRNVIIPPELRLRPTTDDSHLTQAGTAYAELDAQHPDHRGQAQILDAEALQEAVDAELMFDVQVNGEWAGYVGVHPDEHLGLLSYSVQELLLTPAYRGRGYGPHLTTLLARAILAARPTEPGRVLLGTIHVDNAGAYPAALRAGRHDVGGWVQLKL